LAHSRSAEKRHRQSLKRRARNRSVRSAARGQVAKARALIEGGALPDADAAVRQAAAVLDRAQKKGIIHANNAARRKSRLLARYNAALATAVVAQAEAQAVAVAPPEEPVETGRRRRPSRKAAEKPPPTEGKKPAAAKGRARATKAPSKKENKAKKE
jgi:small subunit ribosomal protein S20